MIRPALFVLVALLLLPACSSVGVYSLQKKGARVQQAPTRILVEPFVAPASVFQLGERPESELRTLRTEIVAALARGTAGQLRTYAADAKVITPATRVPVGTWVVRGEIRKVDQGSRALRATIGFGAGRTAMRTRVSVYQVTSAGLVPLLRFNTTGASGLEPGVALGVATGGVATAFSAASAAGGLLLGSLPGVSTDIDRTSYEIAAVVSAYLQRNGLLDPSRAAIQPNMKGRMPSTLNASRAVPAPLRPAN